MSDLAVKPAVKQEMPEMNHSTCAKCAVRLEGMFSALAPDQFVLCEHHRTVRKVKPGEIIFHESDAPAGLYCLAKGKIKLSKAGEHGKQQIVRIAKPGDILGYRSLLLNEPYRATAEALEEGMVCLIPTRTVMESLNRSFMFNRRLLERLARELGEAEQKVLELVDTPAPQRLARALLTLSRRFGRPSGSAVSLEIPLTREEIGEVIGTTPETTIRMLSDLKKRGVVGLSRRHIIIRDVQWLTQLAETGDMTASKSSKRTAP